jgi:hypothetical protein
LPPSPTPARILGLEGYGIAPGCRADLVLEAGDPIEALRLRATRLLVLRAGRVIARTPPAIATLDLPGRRDQWIFASPDRIELRAPVLGGPLIHPVFLCCPPRTRRKPIADAGFVLHWPYRPMGEA